MLGAFLVVFAALYLFCPMVSETRVLKLALAGCLVGGFLVVFGWSVAALFFGNALISFCFLAWQSGISLTLGILLAAVRPPLEDEPSRVPLTLGFARASAASSAGVPTSFSSPPTSTQQRRSLPVVGAIFFLVVAGFVAWRA
jgi:hypothetical protein